MSEPQHLFVQWICVGPCVRVFVHPSVHLSGLAMHVKVTCACTIFIVHALNLASIASLQLLDGRVRANDTYRWSWNWKKGTNTCSLGRNSRMHA